MPVALIPTDNEALAEAYQSGCPLREIAKFYGVGTTTVYRRLKVLRIPMRKPGHGNTGRKAAA